MCLARRFPLEIMPVAVVAVVPAYCTCGELDAHLGSACNILVAVDRAPQEDIQRSRRTNSGHWEHALKNLDSASGGGGCLPKAMYDLSALNSYPRGD